jgi:pimeloyl-ACP methyl ester carboxylesterase
MPITYAADVAALLDELATRDAALVGSSLGGRIALELDMARPDLVSALVLIGAATPEALAAAPEMETYARELMAQSPHETSTQRWRSICARGWTDPTAHRTK